MSSIHDAELAVLKAQYGLVNFVETGTHLGDSVQAALDAGFDRIYSCDLMPQVIAAARQRFAGAGQVRLVCADSVSFLREVVAELRGPAFFWLDAHFPSYYGYPADQHHEFPLAEELAAIAAAPGRGGDVIACDDMRVIADPQNPTYVRGALEARSLGAYVVRNLTIAGLAAPFDATHRRRFIRADEGILLLEPQAPLSAAAM